VKELIKKLVEAWGPSGYEHQVRALIREEVAPFADDIRVDPLGNLMMRFDARQEPKGLLSDLQKLLKLSHIG